MTAPPIRRAVVDVLKPHDPPVEEFARRVAGVESVAAVEATLLEHDREVQNLALAVEGDDVDLSSLEARVEALGGSVHSVDRVACGAYVVGERPTPPRGRDEE